MGNPPARKGWHGMLNALREFVRAHGHLPKAAETAGSLRLGKWCVNQRRAQKLGLLAAERAAELETVSGWYWGQDYDTTWRIMYDALCEFVRTHNRLPRTPDLAGNLRLGPWVTSQRSAHKKGALAAWRAALLEAVSGWYWERDPDAAWYASLDALGAFVQAHDRLPKQSETAGDLRLGLWVHNQRSARLKGALSAEKAARLEAVPGWVWKQDLDAAWRATRDTLQEFVRTHGRFPKEKDVVDGLRLSRWCINQRQIWKKNQLAAWRVALLESVPGWRWR
jgi:hypothetical protein